MKKREERRHHLDRMKAKARRIARDSWNYSEYNDDPKRAEKWANTLCLCSCGMCGNPRKWKWSCEKTRQERMADRTLKEGMDE